MQTTHAPTRKPGDAAGDHLRQEQQAARRQTAEARNEAKRKASEAYDDIRETARQAARDSQGYLRKVVSDQQHTLVQKLEEYRDAAKAACDKLEAENDDKVAQPIRRVAGGLERIADYVRESEPRDLADDAGRLARKRPEIFFGGLFLVGLGVARVVKASARERREEEREPGELPRSSTTQDVRPFANRPVAGPTPATSPAAPTSTPAISSYE